MPFVLIQLVIMVLNVSLLRSPILLISSILRSELKEKRKGGYLLFWLQSERHGGAIPAKVP